MGLPDLISCLFETSRSFNRRPFRSRHCVGALQSGPAQNGIILANGVRQVSIYR
jgi:hypothetical protein